MSHIVVSCKCHIGAYNKIHLWSGIPHSYHCSRTRATRRNKELKRSAIAKVLELTRSHQKRHISEYSWSWPRQTRGGSFSDQRLPPAETITPVWGGADTRFRDSTRLGGRIKMKTSRAHWEEDVLFEKLPANSVQPGCPASRGVQILFKMSCQLAAPPKG